MIVLGEALIEAGECYKQMADVKYAFEDNIKQNFLDPLDGLINKDLKDVYVSFASFFSRVCF